jgi:hypothetical protein
MGQAMKLAVFVFFLTFSALAQTNTWPSACGPKQTRFDVADPDWYLARHYKPSTPAGKATIYFIQQLEISEVNIGIDGAWVGANRASTWFPAAIDPGKHHICEYNPYFDALKLVDIDAQPGKSYYLVLYYPMSLESIDAQEGSRLIFKTGISHFQEKKKATPKKETAPVN